MNGFRRLTTLLVVLCFITSCATNSQQDESALQSAEDLSALDSSAADGDLEAELDQAKAEDNLGQEENQANNQEQNKDEFADFEETKKEEPLKEEPIKEEPPVVAEQPPPPDFTAQAEPIPEVKQEPPPAPEAPAEAMPSSGLVTLKSIQFKANDNGGTIIIDATGPMTYSTRLNAASGQFVVDVPNSILPKKLTRPLVTKDFQGAVGSIDAYQSPGSNVSRIVVHLRPGVAEPIVQNEGSSLLIVSSESPRESISSTGDPQHSQVKLLSYDSLEEFISGNMQFSGKKISIETDDMEIKDIFKLISEEGGVNLVLTDDVKGKMSVKLRQVPWDQALIMIMRAKKLSYTKTGSVLRIAPIADIRAEEDDTLKMAESRRKVAPLKVKLIPVSYAKVDELEKQVTKFLSKDRGQVIADPRTSSLVITDVEESIERITKLVQSIDIPPEQVLIEGKVVEASDRFENHMGIDWIASGKPVSVGTGINATTAIGLTPGTIKSPTAAINFNLGVLDILGDLTATLALKESEGSVKVLSSPRIVTLHNETAEINQVQELPIITTTPNPGGPATPTVTFKPVRLKLGVTPQITNDGGVIMKVEVNREFAGEVVEQNSQARAINSRSANTKVLVRNGQTAVIGGVYQSDMTESNARVPWLGQLPVVGWLFKSNSKTTEKNELLIFLTPRILGQLDSQTMKKSNDSSGDGLDL